MSDKILGKPEPHSDVINKEPKTLLIGYGWVGQFVHRYFTQADYYTPNGGLMLRTIFSNAEPQYQRYERYDKEREKSLTTQYSGEPIIPPVSWDLAFVNTPSPMNKDGSCDTSVVEGAVKQWHKFVKLFVIRSTVVPGTIDKLQKMYPDNLFVMQPEYVGETLGHPLTDPDRQTFVIIGGTKEATKKAAEHWSKVLHAGARIRQTDALTAEFCKYMENCFLATKVIFVNDWARLCRKAGVDYLELREAWLDDPRIGRSHTLAYEENPGFSGKCLPKDLNSIASYARGIGEPLELVEAILEINARMRKNCKNTVPLMPEPWNGNEKQKKEN